ncbi:hypothetical protein BP6252_05572 [Coleophoma cylindrospora]|uniref:Uncharacterized protein n=1 Tax=Coleophoma cylindrospora TaxID=1849047 RepID=A0A3D8RTZ0_9HELO|nr:hypothetical protein BP6252_05572 [Coleophoma cylindrospora]
MFFQLQPRSANYSPISRPHYYLSSRRRRSEIATMKYFVPLVVSLALLLVDSAIQLALISAMVGYLHRSGANQYLFAYNDTSVFVNAKPKGLLLNEGHTSNGAAGSALVLVCFGGFFMIWWLRRRAARNVRKPSYLFVAYTVVSILALVLTLVALSWTFALTNQTSGQHINTLIAAQSQHNAYPADEWTPGTWTDALLDLPLIYKKDRAYLKHWRHVIEGWKWNAIPLFLVESVAVVFICLTFWEDWKVESYTEKNMSPHDTSGGALHQSGIQA